MKRSSGPRGVIQAFVEFANSTYGKEELIEAFALGLVLGIFQRDSMPHRAVRGDDFKEDIAVAACREVESEQNKVRSFLSFLVSDFDQSRFLEFKIACDFRCGANFRLGQSGYGQDRLNALVRLNSGAMMAPVGKIHFPAYLFKLLMALNDFPTSSLGRCTKCGTFFFNSAANRLKFYCSHRCQNAAAVQRAYQKKKKG